MRTLLGRGLVAVALAGLGGAAAQTVLVVGPAAGPGIDFTSLPAATAAAGNGDVVLVLPGTYPGVANVTNKSVAVVGVPDAAGVRPHFEELFVRNTQPGATVLVRGLAYNIGINYEQVPLYVLNCSGPVLVEDCTLDLSGYPPGSGWESTIVNDSSRVIFSRCVLWGSEGGVGTTLASPGSDALHISNSTVTIDACTVHGGDGGDGLAYPNSGLFRPSQPGGMGVVLASGTLNLRGTVVTGGQGGDGSSAEGNLACVTASAGGNALQINGLLRRVDAPITGGAAGVASACGGSASAGADVNLLGGSVVDLSGNVGQLEISAIIPDGGSASLKVQGTPGDMVLVLHALSGAGLWVGGVKGTLVPSVPFVTLPLAPVPASGELVLEFDLPPVLPPGLGGVLLLNQALLVPPVGKGVLTNATGSVLVADAP